jgi:hypothetical protein
MLYSEDILLVCPAVTNRIVYIARFLSDRIGVRISPVAAGEFTAHVPGSGGSILHYGRENMPDAFNVFSSGLLSETGIRQQEPAQCKQGGQTYLFPAPDGFDLPFDMLSACFFLLTRYEEYLPFVPDHHGRYEAHQSQASQNGFLEEPVVDQWLALFIHKLKQKFPGHKFLLHQFRFVSTFDIDNPWAYLHKGLVRTTAGILKVLASGQIQELLLRVSVLTGKKPDPYDTYDYILGMEERYRFRSLFFLLCADYGGFDANYALHTRFFRKLVSRLGEGRSLGIHPSCRSHGEPDRLRAECRRFEVLLGQSARISRQHFLLLTLPDTYRNLISLGIREDYSMGYASAPGFRAGTSRSFRFYDLRDEKETELEVFPFVLMDVTLRQYLSLSPDQALDRITRLMDRVKAVGGTFTSLWHNESLSDTGVWQGWRQVFEGMVREGTGDEGQGTRDKKKK